MIAHGKIKEGKIKAVCFQNNKPFIHGDNNIYISELGSLLDESKDWRIVSLKIQLAPTMVSHHQGLVTAGCPAGPS